MKLKKFEPPCAAPDIQIAYAQLYPTFKPKSVTHDEYSSPQLKNKEKLKLRQNSKRTRKQTQMQRNRKPMQKQLSHGLTLRELVK